MGFLKFKVHTKGLSVLQRKFQRSASPAAHAVAVQATKDTSRYVPMRTGSLDQRTQVTGSRIIYPGPYARMLYRGKVMVDARTGKGPMHFTDKNGNEYFRYRKGAVLKPSSRDLNIRRDAHSLAQSQWFEASKRDNMEKWERVGKAAVIRGLK